ncbi:MAG: histidine phosphatase family protein [Candidatus Komeilibacteria bacterium]
MPTSSRQTNKPAATGPYTEIYLIRHGHPDYTQKNIVGDKAMPLSKLGQQQSRLLRKRLLKVDPQIIYSSNLQRAQETAAIATRDFHHRININKNLNEFDWTEWQKIKYFNVQENNRHRTMHSYRRLDKQLDKVQTKMRRELAKLWRRHRNKKIAVFCHGNMIRAMLTSIINADVIGFLSMEIYESSVSKVAIDKDGFIKVNYINSIRHLPHKPDEDIFRASIND